MERLTERDCLGGVQTGDLKDGVDERKAFDRLAAYEDTGLTPEKVAEYQHLCETYVEAGLDSKFVQFCIDATQNGLSLEGLCKLAQAETDGRLVVLPCKVGDTVYEANKRGFVSTYKVISVHISDCSVLIGWELIDGIYSNLNGFEVSALAKTIFRTREEAEAALKKREDDNEAD